MLGILRLDSGQWPGPSQDWMALSLKLQSFNTTLNKVHSSTFRLVSLKLDSSYLGPVVMYAFPCLFRSSSDDSSSDSSPDKKSSKKSKVKSFEYSRAVAPDNLT